MAIRGRTNKANYQIAQETNAANKEINEMQIGAAYNMQDRANQFTREQFAAENAEYDRRYDRDFEMQNAEYDRRTKDQRDYDSATAQRERLEAAGLNPYLMMDGGSAGSAAFQAGSSGASNPGSHQGASQSVPSMLPMQAAQMQPISDRIMSGLQTSVDTALDIVKGRAGYEEAKYGAMIAKDNARVITAKNNNELARQRLENENLRMEYRKRGLDFNYDQQTLDSRVAAAKKQPNLIDSQIGYNTALTKAQEAKLPFIADQEYQKLQQGAAEIALTKAKTSLTKAQQNLAKSQVSLNEYDLSSMRPVERKKLVRECVKIKMEAASELADAIYAQKSALGIPEYTKEQARQLADITIQTMDAKAVKAEKDNDYYLLNLIFGSPVTAAGTHALINKKGSTKAKTSSPQQQSSVGVPYN
jgi:hypothetical protein